ncbi:MAG: hypothetical protein ACFCUG_12830 [Thiotrichales bacterium]
MTQPRPVSNATYTRRKFDTIDAIAAHPALPAAAMAPPLTAVGPGAVSGFLIGLIIATGLGIGTLYTLIVVAAINLWLARGRLIGLAYARNENHGG